MVSVHKHLGRSVPLVSIEVLQNQPGLHTTVFFSIDPSRLNHPQIVSELSWHPILSVSSAPSDVRSPHLWDRRGLSRFSFSPTRLTPKLRFPTSLIVEKSVHRVQQIRIFDFLWHEHVVVALQDHQKV